MVNRFSKYIESDTEKEQVSPSASRFEKYITPSIINKSSETIIEEEEVSPSSNRFEKYITPVVSKPTVIQKPPEEEKVVSPDTAPPPIVSTDVTEEEADQLLAPYLPPQEVGGSLKVVDPRKPDPRLQGWESMILGDQDLSKEEVDEYIESISEEFEIPDYKYSMDQLKNDPKWEKLGKKIYDHDIKSGASAFQMPATVGGDVTKPEDQSYGEWLAERQSKLYDFTSQGLTAWSTSDMPKDVKKAWAESLDMWAKTEGNLDSFTRAAWHTISDPVNAAILLVGGLLTSIASRSSLLRELPSKLGISLSGKLQSELMKEGIEEGLAKKLVKGKTISQAEEASLIALRSKKGITDSLAKKMIEKDIVGIKKQTKEGLAKRRFALAPPVVGAWSTVGDALQQNIEIGVGVPDYEKINFDEVEENFKTYFINNEDKITKAAEDQGISIREFIEKERENHLNKQIFLPENIKKDFDFGRSFQAFILGSGFGGALGFGGYTLGMGMRKLSDTLARRRGTDKRGYKVSPVIETRVVGKMNEEGQPVYNNTFDSLPEQKDKHIIGSYIKKGTSLEDIFNEAIKINNILLPETTERGGGIVQISVDKGMSKREINQIKNKFRLANIRLEETGTGAADTIRFEGRKVDDAVLSDTGRPIDPLNPVHVKTTEIIDEDIAGNPVITERNRVTEFVANVNNLLGRGFKTTGALPKELAELTKQRKSALKGINMEIKGATKTLRKVQKDTGMSDDDLAFAINEDVLNVQTSRGDNYFVPAPVQREVNNLKRIIQRNEDELNDLLGLKGEDRIGLGVSKNEVYLTRNYEASFNPKYYDQIEKVLAGKGKAKYVDRVRNARIYFQDLIEREAGESKQAFNNRVDGVISQLVARVSKEEMPWFQNIFEGQVAHDLGEYATKVLKKRQNLDMPILDLLGEIKNPYRKIASTLMNQNSLISEINFLKGVERYALQNLDKVIDLDGLISMLPKKRTTFTLEPRSGRVTSDLGKLVDEAIGRFGSRPVKGSEDMERLILKDIFTTPYMANIIRNGTDLGYPDAILGKAILGRYLGRIAAFGQAGQTILDFPSAYALNLQGAVQSLAMNGYLGITNPKASYKNLKEVYGGVKLLMKQAKAQDPAAVRELAELKRQGVIETDIVSENIIRNIDMGSTGDVPLKLFEKGRGSLKLWLGDAYNRALKFAGEGYAIPDSWSKIVAHRMERNILRDIYTVKEPRGLNVLDPDTVSRLLIPEEELFRRASETIRKVMPSYNDAWPFAKALGRVPIGTYALFPSEIVRTSLNIPVQAVKHINEGISIKYNKTYGNNSNRIGNKLIGYGATRLMYAGTVIAGVEAIINTNNKANDITDYDKRGLDLLAPDWGKGANRYFLRPTAEQKDGRIIGSYIASTSFDAYDTIKMPVRQILGKYIAGENVSPLEVQELVDGLKASVLGPYTNSKFLYEALMNVRAGIDIETGRPLHSKVPKEETGKRFWTNLKEIYEAIDPGSIGLIPKWKEAVDSEKHRGGDFGRSSYGFPLTTRDMAIWTLSGIRPVTFDLKKAIGFNLSKDIKALGESPKELLREISKLDDEKYTPETEQKIVDIYNNFQQRNYEATSDLSEKARIYSNMTYSNTKNKIVPLGIEGVLNAASNNFWYDIPPKLLLSNLDTSVKEGIFIADNPIKLKKEIIRIFIDKGWTTNIGSVLNALGNAYGQNPSKDIKREE
tara:strand:+ start:3617 stop:8722 length:5106 start_codon:yes stop_codon:yes gene_type:complete